MLEAVNAAWQQLLPECCLLLERILPGWSQALTLQDDMSKQFAVILEEIDQKQGKVDFSEVLEALQTTSLASFFLIDGAFRNCGIPP